MFGYIAGNLHVYEQVRSAQSGCNSGLENYDDDVYFSFSFACIRTSLGSYFCLSVCFSMSVMVSGYIMTHCMSIYCSAVCLCVSFALNICINIGLYCH